MAKKTEKKSEEFALKQLTINGLVYPLEMTMGVFLEYKRMTGIDFSESDQSSIATNIELIYCMAKTTAKRKKIDFPFEDVVDFASYITPEMIQEVA